MPFWEFGDASETGRWKFQFEKFVVDRLEECSIHENKYKQIICLKNIIQSEIVSRSSAWACGDERDNG